MNPFIRFDHTVFEQVNSVWTHPFLDWLMPAITDLHKDPRSLVIFLPLILLWVIQKRGFALKCLLVLGLSIGLSDLVSYRVIKKTTQRDRPQYTEGLKVELRTHEHSGTSFPSNHAANVFAGATVLSLANPALWPVFFLIAGAVAYSRVYVGVHFPLDVIGGALLGFSIATFVWILFRQWILKSPGAIFRSVENDDESRRGRKKARWQ